MMGNNGGEWGNNGVNGGGGKGGMNGEMGVNGVSEWGLWGAGGVSGAGGVLRRPRVRGERERECAKRVCKAGVRGVQGGVHTSMQGSSGAACTRVCKGGHHHAPIRTHTPCTTGASCTLTLHQLTSVQTDAQQRRCTHALHQHCHNCARSPLAHSACTTTTRCTLTADQQRHLHTHFPLSAEPFAHSPPALASHQQSSVHT